MGKLTVEDIYDKYTNYLTIGRLKEAIQDLDDDVKVVVERVEDKYFEKHGWDTLKVEGFDYYQCLEHNKNVKENLEEVHVFSDEELEKMKEEFHPAWWSTKYGDDKKLLLIHMHY